MPANSVCSSAGAVWETVRVHSLAGCFLYGAFAAKVLLVRSKRLSGWVLPVAGGTLVTVVVLLWYTAALWYFNGFRLPHL